ncbi:glycosyltransferase family 9 protein [Erwinia sp. CGal63]|uniref:glycosyltransferase family 9 protein n=1 Tax=Erwinia sp. CGal63 TaxID=2919889 RepID=UPI00300BC036
MKSSSPGLLYRLKKLNRKRNRYFHELKRRARLVYLARPLPTAQKSERFPEGMRKILFPFVNLGIGDAVCHTGLWRKLKEVGYSVQIISESRSEVFFRGLDFIDEIFIVDIDNIDRLERIKTDIVVSLYSWMQRKELLETELLSRIDYSYAINIGGWLKKPYHMTLDLPDNFHITVPQKLLLTKLGHPVSDLHYRLKPPAASNEFIAKYLHKSGERKRVVISPFASVGERSMTLPQLEELIAKLRQQDGVNLFITGEKHKLASLVSDTDNVFICDFDSLWHTIALVNNADLVISVETAIVHVACALNKKLVSIFYSTNINYNDALQSNTIFKPIGKDVKQIIVNRTTLPFETDKVIQESLAMLSSADVGEPCM